jgi:hypothetical protein
MRIVVRMVIEVYEITIIGFSRTFKKFNDANHKHSLMAFLTNISLAVAGS